MPSYVLYLNVMLTYNFPLQNQTSILSSECVNLLYCSALSGDLKEDVLVYSLDFDFILYLPAHTLSCPTYIYPQNSAASLRNAKRKQMWIISFTFCINKVC